MPVFRLFSQTVRVYHAALKGNVSRSKVGMKSDVKLSGAELHECMYVLVTSRSPTTPVSSARRVLVRRAS